MTPNAAVVTHDPMPWRDVIKAEISHHVSNDPAAALLFGTILDWGVGRERASVQEVAYRTHRSKRQLLRYLSRHGYPAPSVILGWGRTLHAMDLYRSRSLIAAAWDSGWPDPFTLSHAVRTRTGLRPTEWRGSGTDMADLCVRMVNRWLQDGR